MKIRTGSPGLPWSPGSPAILIMFIRCWPGYSAWESGHRSFCWEAWPWPWFWTLLSPACFWPPCLFWPRWFLLCPKKASPFSPPSSPLWTVLSGWSGKTLPESESSRPCQRRTAREPAVTRSTGRSWKRSGKPTWPRPSATRLWTSFST